MYMHKLRATFGVAFEHFEIAPCKTASMIMSMHVGGGGITINVTDSAS